MFEENDTRPPSPSIKKRMKNMIEYSTDLDNGIAEEENRRIPDDYLKGMKFCIISAIMHILSFPAILFAIASISQFTSGIYDGIRFGYGVDASEFILFAVCTLFAFAGPIFSLISLIFMIIARVKYPKNKFGLALMILYIAEVVLVILALALMVIIGVIAGVSVIGDLISELIGSL